MRITTDIRSLGRAAPEAEVRSYPPHQYPNAWVRRIRLLLSAVRSDHLVIDFSLLDVIWFASWLTVIPFQRCRITTVDFFTGDLSGIRLKLARWSLRRVARALVYFKDTSVFERKFGFSPALFHYIPFKINSVELIRQTPVTDEGYVFSGGRSRRDFATFFAAVEPLGYPVKVVTSTEAEMRPHGSTLNGVRIPPNVEIINNDPSAQFFVRTMAASRLVVIPIIPDVTTQAGIGVYLQAMAQQKCVIVSSGLGVSDVLTGNEACVVPAGDVDALRQAIQKLWSDDELRDRYAQAGFLYVAPLGGEDELLASIIAALPAGRAALLSNV